MLTIRENRIDERLNLREVGNRMDQEVLQEMRVNNFSMEFIKFQEQVNGLLGLYDLIDKMSKNYFDLTYEELNLWFQIHVRVLRRYSNILGSHAVRVAEELLKAKEFIATKENIEKYYR